jgi:hypothetical protein
MRLSGGEIRLKIVMPSGRLKFICNSARIFTNMAVYYVIRIPKSGAIAPNITIERQRQQDTKHEKETSRFKNR